MFADDAVPLSQASVAPQDGLVMMDAVSVETPSVIASNTRLAHPRIP